MFIKRMLCFFMAALFIFPLLMVGGYAEEYKISETGLVAWYDAAKNAGDKYDPDATVWADLKGDNDISVAKTETNYFTESAYHLSNASYNFPKAILDVINGEEFTVEIKLGQIEKTGSSFTTLINSDGNDNFALFIRTSGDYLEFKASSNSRPKYTGGTAYFEESTVAVTFSMSQKVCSVYVDGVAIGSVNITKTVGAAGNLFFGHTGSTKAHTANYEGFRFYNRALTSDEVATNAKADGNYDFDYVAPKEFVNVGQKKTNIAGGIAFVEEILTMDQAQTFLGRENMPAVAIIYVNKDLLLTDDKGTLLGGSLADLMAMSDNTVIPAYYVKDDTTVTALLDYLKKEGYEDFYIMSDKPELVKAARAEMTIARGILDLTAQYADKTDLDKEDLIAIRKLVFSNDCKIAVLPQSVANKEDIGTLCKWQVTPWVKADKGLTGKVDALSLLLSSAYGIISDNTELLTTVATNTLVNGTLARTPVIIGHRGLGGITTDAPENTLKSAILAYNAGANAVEFDIYITKDGKVVANHNSTTNKMANISDDKPVSVSIENSNYAQLKRYYYTGYFLKDENGEFILDENGEKQVDKTMSVDLLEDYLKYFKGKDIQLVIEIKSTQKDRIVKAVKTLIDQYEMYDQVNIIAFGRTNAFESLRELYPEMNIGYLTDSTNANSDSNKAIQAALSEIQKYNMTYNPSKKGYTSAFVRAATYRGVTTWPWTFYNDSEIYQYITYGHAGITTDYSTMITDFVRDLKATSPENCASGSSFEITVSKMTYGREDIIGLDENTEIILVGGEELVDKLDGNKITLRDGAEGTLYYMVSYKQTMNKDYNYTIYTQPIAVNVGGTVAEEVIVTGYEGYVTENEVELFIRFSVSSIGKKISLAVGEKTEELTVTEKGVSVKLAKTALNERITVRFSEETIVEYSLNDYLTAVSALESATTEQKAVANALLNGVNYGQYLTTVKKEEE